MGRERNRRDGHGAVGLMLRTEYYLLLGRGKIAPATEEGRAERNGAERNGAVRKMSGRGEQGEAAEEGGKLRSGAGRGGGRGRKVARWSRERRRKRAESCAVGQGEAA